MKVFDVKIVGDVLTAQVRLTEEEVVRLRSANEHLLTLDLEAQIEGIATGKLKPIECCCEAYRGHAVKAGILVQFICDQHGAVTYDARPLPECTVHNSIPGIRYPRR